MHAYRALFLISLSLSEVVDQETIKFGDQRSWLEYQKLSFLGERAQIYSDVASILDQI